MSNYKEYIPEQLARKLLEYGYPIKRHIEYDGTPCFDIPMMGEEGWENGNRYSIPTYGEVFDWFCNTKSIIITLEPFFTMSLKNHIAYTWKISYPNSELPKLDTIDESAMFTSGGFGGSFKTTADEAIQKSMELEIQEIEDVQYTKVITGD